MSSRRPKNGLHRLPDINGMDSMSSPLVGIPGRYWRTAPLPVLARAPRGLKARAVGETAPARHLAASGQCRLQEEMRKGCSMRRGWQIVLAFPCRIRRFRRPSVRKARHRACRQSHRHAGRHAPRATTFIEAEQHKVTNALRRFCLGFRWLYCDSLFSEWSYL